MRGKAILRLVPVLLLTLPLAAAEPSDPREESATYASTPWAGVYLHDPPPGGYGWSVGGPALPTFVFQHGETHVDVTIDDHVIAAMGGHWSLEAIAADSDSHSTYASGAACGGLSLDLPGDAWTAYDLWVLRIQLPYSAVNNPCPGQAAGAITGTVTATFS